MSTTDYTGTCASGYTGIKCSACLPGYSKSNKGSCDICPSEAQNICILFLLVLALVIICIILVKTTIKSAFASKSRHSIYIKIFTNYLQLIFLASQFSLQ